MKKLYCQNCEVLHFCNDSTCPICGSPLKKMTLKLVPVTGIAIDKNGTTTSRLILTAEKEKTK